MKNLILIIAVLLTACGSDQDCDNDSNAPYVYHPIESNNKNIILHNGHGPWSCYMTAAANKFTDSGFTVYRAEMPISPHDKDSDFFAETNILLNKLADQDIYMVGLSGGGWTTTMVTALNSEIIKGYSIAGDHPTESYIQGDWEQHNPPLEYGEAYAIAGNRLMHIYNYYDSCCFNGITGDIGIPYVTDYTHDNHLISEWSVDYIIQDINLKSEI